MLSTTKNFLFIHPQKSAGTSISLALKDYAEDQMHIRSRHPDGSPHWVKISCPAYGLIGKHHTLVEYRARLHADLFARLFKFSIIRNPWERMVIRYFQYHRDWDEAQFRHYCLRFQRLRRMICLNYPRRPFEMLRRWLGRPAKDRGPLDGDIDFLMRYEHLEEDFAILCRRLDIADAKLPHVRTTRYAHKDYRSYYNPALIEWVGSVFSEEIEFGGYQFDG